MGSNENTVAGPTRRATPAAVTTAPDPSEDGRNAGDCHARPERRGGIGPRCCPRWWRAGAGLGRWLPGPLRGLADLRAGLFKSPAPKLPTPPPSLSAVCPRRLDPPNFGASAVVALGLAELWPSSPWQFRTFGEGVSTAPEPLGQVGRLSRLDGHAVTSCRPPAL